MKKIVPLVVLAAAIGGLVWLVWFRPPPPQDEEQTPATDVAVQVGKITRATLRGYVTAYGTVQPAPAGEKPAASARVAPAVAGVIAKVNCAEGREVKQGDVLFQLDSRAADVAVEFAEKTLDRQQKLANVDGTSQRVLQDAQQQLDAARVQQQFLQVRSPLDGTVTHLNVKAGEAVDLTTVLAEITDLGRLEVSAGVPSDLATLLKSGQSVSLQTEPPVNAVVSFVSTVVDPANGTLIVRAALPASAGLRPGQFVGLHVETQQRTNCLAAPAESVVTDDSGESFVAIVNGDEAVRTPVKTGLQENGLIEVESNDIKEGDTVVTTGAYGLPPKTKVRISGS